MKLGTNEIANDSFFRSSGRAAPTIVLGIPMAYFWWSLSRGADRIGVAEPVGIYGAIVSVFLVLGYATAVLMDLRSKTAEE